MNHTSRLFLPDIHVNALSLIKKYWRIWFFSAAVVFLYHEAKGEWNHIFLGPAFLSIADVIRQFFSPFRVLAVEFDDEAAQLIVRYKPHFHPEIAMQISYERLQVKVYQRRGWWTKRLNELPTKLVLMSNTTEMIDIDERKGFSDSLLAELYANAAAVTNKILVR